MTAMMHTEGLPSFPSVCGAYHYCIQTLNRGNFLAAKKDSVKEKKVLDLTAGTGDEPKSGFEGEATRKQYTVVFSVTIKPEDGDGLTRRITIESLFSTREVYDPELIREALFLADKKVKPDNAQTALPV
jgi:hypothetical protein